MLSFAASISLFAGIFVCYSVGIMLGWLLNRTLDLSPKISIVSLENNSEKRLRTEVRDDISRIILEVLENGEEPTLLYLAELCPTHFRTGNAWVLWQRESYQMLKNILGENASLF